jgi:hypothetical protein
MSEIFVVGNGKSLKDFDFNFLKDKEWIGLCLAFRHWDELGFYPTHYVCVDSVVCKHHVEKIKEMIINKKCKSFLLCASIIEHFPTIRDYTNVYFIQQFKQQPKNVFRNLIDYCSGTSAVCFAYVMGKKKINMLGMDCDYVEFLPECVKQKNGTLKIIKTPKENPNYYFNSYQRKGDIYNPPNTERVHKQSWFDLRNIFILFNILRQQDIILMNYNFKDTLGDLFETFLCDKLIAEKSQVNAS